MRVPTARVAHHILLSIVSLTALVTLSGSSIAAETQQLSLRQTFDELVAAAQKGDDAALAKYHSKNMTVIDGSGFTQGSSTYSAKVEKSEAAANASHAVLRDYRVHDVQVHESGGVGWITYTYRLVAPANAEARNTPRPIFGFATIVLQKLDGRWQVVHAHTTGRAPQDSDPKF